ncbi:hypothetical protein MMPV_000157 [Pyropia vietnamensis]
MVRTPLLTTRQRWVERRPRWPFPRPYAAVVAAVAAVVAAATLVDAGIGGNERSRPLDRLAKYARVCWTAVAIPCAHTFSETGTAGCAECTGVSFVAPVNEYQDDEGVDSFLGTRDDSARMVLLSWALASRKRTLDRLAAVGHPHVAAVLITGVDPRGGGPAAEDIPPGGVSPAAGRPNGAYVAAPEAGPRWNVNGNGMDEMSLPFNVFVLPPEAVAEVRRRSARYLEPPPLTSPSAPPRLPPPSSPPLPPPSTPPPAEATPTPASSSSLPPGGGSTTAPTVVPTSQPPPPPSPSASASASAPAVASGTKHPRFVIQTTGSSAACRQTTSAECLGNGTCTPIGGYTVWAVAGGRLIPDRASAAIPGAAAGEYVAVSAPRDSRALVQGAGVGATAEVSAAVMVMAVAQAFGVWHRSYLAGGGSGGSRRRRLPRLPVYFLWDAESAGFAGSGRFLRDLAAFDCRDELDEKALEADVRGALSCTSPRAWSRAFEAFRLPQTEAVVAQTPSAGAATPMPEQPPPPLPPRNRFTHVLDVGSVGTAQRRAGRSGGSPKAGVVDAADFANTPLYVHAGPSSEGLRQTLLSAFAAERVRPWEGDSPATGPPADGRKDTPPEPGTEELPLAAPANRSWPLFPPTSGQSWARWATATADADLPDGRPLNGPVVVALTDYDAALRSTVFHSQLDVLPSDIRPMAETIALAARGVVRSLVVLALADDPPNATVAGGIAPPPPADPTTLRYTLAPATAAAADEAAAAVDEATIVGLLRCWAFPWAPLNASTEEGCPLATDLLGKDAMKGLRPAAGAFNWAGPHTRVRAWATLPPPTGTAKTRLARAFLARATAAGTDEGVVRCPEGNEEKCKSTGGVCVSDVCVPAAVHLHEAYGPGIELVQRAPTKEGDKAPDSFTVPDPWAGLAAWAVAPTGSLTVCGKSEDGSGLNTSVLTVGVGVAVSSLLAAAGVRYGLMVAAMADRHARWRRAVRPAGWVPHTPAVPRTQ